MTAFWSGDGGCSHLGYVARGTCRSRAVRSPLDLHVRERGCPDKAGLSSGANNAAISGIAFDGNAWQPPWARTARRARERRWPRSPSTSTCRLTVGDPVDRAPRATAPRRPAQPVPLADVPLLGPLHRCRRRSRRPQRTHMRVDARVEGNIHRLKDSGAQRFPSPTSRPAACGWPLSASPTVWCVGSSSSAHRDPGPRRAQNPALGTVAHPGTHRAPGARAHRGIVRILDGGPARHVNHGRLDKPFGLGSSHLMNRRH